MSRAGTKSNQGDDYQRLVALSWLIRVLDNDVQCMQAESNGLPGVDEKILVDDIVIVYQDNHRRYIQVKKNQPNNRSWSLSDLKDELPKIKTQLNSNENTIVELCSQTPFGDLQSLCSASREYPNLQHFQQQTGEKLKNTLSQLSEKWNESKDNTFKLLQRLEFGPHHNFQSLKEQNKLNLGKFTSSVKLAMPLLESFINRHQSKLDSPSFTINKDSILECLQKNNLYPKPSINKDEILQQFQLISNTGRNHQCDIKGIHVKRVEFNRLTALIESETKGAILIIDKPGSGKTCLLLNIATYVENSESLNLLFLKGDIYTKTDELSALGSMDDLVIKCSHLSKHCKIIVIIDSLDVLSINKEHGALSNFLKLIDQLEKIQNILVIVACRLFDLQYDPSLRNRKWLENITLTGLSFDTDVIPLLQKLNISSHKINDTLKKSLQLPQNLKLFVEIAQCNHNNIHNEYDLHRKFLEETVSTHAELGTLAMTELQNFAKSLIERRIHKSPLIAFTGGDKTRRVLISNGVLTQSNNDSLEFSHQTLFDSVLVNSILAKGGSLTSFILSHPPFPFLRPAVRTFFFYLRSIDTKLFTKQVWEVVASNDVAYHLKRLIVESLAEIELTKQDKSLINRIFKKQPELFHRLLLQLKNDDWFQWLTSDWLSMLKTSHTDKNWHLILVSRLEIWLNTHPEKVIALWQQALSNEWADLNQLTWRISVGINHLERWHTPGILKLIQTLEKNKLDRDMIGKVVSRYVKTTNQGDKLLWQYITKNLNKDKLDSFEIEKKLSLSSHNFHNQNFFKNRLINSTILLDLAIEDLKFWHTKNCYQSKQHLLNASFLNNSSYEKTHSLMDVYHGNSLTDLLNGIEKAFLHHAKNDDIWWQKNEVQLRECNEMVLRYFLIMAYTKYPERNTRGIAIQLLDRSLLRYGRIDYEIGVLINRSYCLISEEVQEQNQKIIFNLYSEDGKDEDNFDWVARTKYDYLINIPSIYRLPQTQQLIDYAQSVLGKITPEPNIQMSGGTVRGAISLDVLLLLSDKELFRLLNYFSDYKDWGWGDHPSDHLKGGGDMLAYTLGKASAFDPIRYIKLVPKLRNNNLWLPYLTNLLEGIANHLRYRSGKLVSDKNWKSIEPKPSINILIEFLLNSLEKYSEIWADSHAAARIFESCCESVDSSDSAQRLIFISYRLLKCSNPGKDEQVIFNQGKDGITSRDLLHKGINSARGIAVQNSVKLYFRLLENNIEIPVLLFPLLRHYARDKTQSVRATLLQQIPYITSKNHDLGWQLFNDIFRESQTHLWDIGEQHLYYQYHKYFNKVAPFLNRMRDEACGKGVQSWGRVMTLSYLSSHISEKKLFEQLRITKNKAYQGSAEIFSANLKQHTDLCINGLKKIMQVNIETKHLFNIIERSFNIEQQGRYLNQEFALYFIDNISSFNKEHYDFHNLLGWIANIATYDPLSALDVCEFFVQKIEELNCFHQIYDTKLLVSTLTSILQEADNSNDEQLIHRTIKLQDKFLQIDINGMDEYFNQATQ